MRAHLYVAGGVASLLVAGGIGLATVGGDGPAPESTVVLADATRAAPAAEAKRPRDLPPGVRPASELPVGGNGAYQILYALPGAANANTIPAEGLTHANYRSVHPATELTFAAVPWSDPDTFPDLMFDAELAQTDVVFAKVAGHPARLSVPRSGLGVQRVEWIAGGWLYTLLCDRVAVHEGVAGLDREALLRIAESVR